MTTETAKQLRPGMRVYCQSPGRIFDCHQVLVTSVDVYEEHGEVFVMGRLPDPPKSMGLEAYVFEPQEIEVLQ